MIKKIRNFKFVIRNCQAGFTYVELIVVLSIFAVLSSVAIFNYGSFETKVDLKNLASDIALQIVQAQKAALSGLLLPSGTFTNKGAPGGKPSYGVFFNTNGTVQGANSTDFIYFADLNNDYIFNDSDCVGECISKYIITKGDSISKLSYFNQGDSTEYPLNNNNLTITFIRPNSSATLYSGGIALPANVSYVQITVTDQKKDIFSYIKLYPPGRVEVD